MGQAYRNFLETRVQVQLTYLADAIFARELATRELPGLAVADKEQEALAKLGEVETSAALAMDHWRATEGACSDYVSFKLATGREFPQGKATLDICTAGW